MNKPAAVLWDLDGTLIDSEPIWISAERRIAAAVGKEWTHQDGLDLVGRPLSVSGQMLIDKLGLDEPVEAIVETLVAEVSGALRAGEFVWRPGARDLVESLREARIPQALVTMSYTPIAEAINETLRFDVVITGDTVEHGKPHPEPYLKAAAQLGVDAGECIAFEDSPSGLGSAQAAGCLTVAVPNMVALDLVPVHDGERRVTVPSLLDVTPGYLSGLFA